MTTAAAEAIDPDMSDASEEVPLPTPEPTPAAPPPSPGAAASPLPRMVRLLSGGPAMTVAGAKDGAVVCVWFAGDDMRSQALPPHMLVPVREPQS